MSHVCILLFGSLILVSAVAGAAEDKPAGGHIAVKQVVHPPTISLIGLSPLPEGASHIRLRFNASNANAFVVPYLGYRADGFTPNLPTGMIAPLYRLQFQSNGQWKETPIGWCGFGMGEVELPPLSKKSFDVSIPKAGWEAVKVGIEWYPTPERKGDPSTAWSMHHLVSRCRKDCRACRTRQRSRIAVKSSGVNRRLGPPPFARHRVEDSPPFSINPL